MSSSSFHPITYNINLDLSVRKGRAEEGEDPKAYFQVQLINKYTLLSDSNSQMRRSGLPFTVLDEREYAPLVRNFQTQMSSLKYPAASLHLLSLILSTIGFNLSVVENFIPHIWFCCQGWAEEAMSEGVTSMFVTILLKVQSFEFSNEDFSFAMDTWASNYDEVAAFALAATESMNDAVEGQAISRGPHGSRSLSEIEDFLKNCRIDRFNSVSDCMICLEHLGDDEMGEEIIRLPCSHLFHMCCIRRWLEESDSCPLCRLHV